MISLDALLIPIQGVCSRPRGVVSAAVFTAARLRVDLARVASALLLAAVALVTRASLRAQVFEGGEVTPIEVDAYFHLRRIVRTAESFPTLAHRDPLLGWPRGAVCPWPEGFDWIIAATARLAGCSTTSCASTVAAWFPAAAGVAVVLATWALCLRLLRGAPGATGASLLAGLVVALAPQSVATSVVGRIDHHVAEQATVLALLAWCLARPEPDADRGAALRFELAGAAALGISVWCFNGSVLYAATAGAVLALRALASTGRPPRVGLGAIAFFSAALFVAWRAAPAVRESGRVFDYLYTSFLQPTLLVILGALLLAAGEIARADRRSPAVSPLRRVAGRSAVMVAVGALALAALVAFVPAVHHTVADGAHRWLAREDRYMAGIGEVQPIFGASLRAGAATVYRTFGAAGFAHPLALLAALLGFARYRRRGALELGAFWAVLTLFTLLQMRFGRVLAPIAAIAIGAGTWALSERLRELPRAARVAAALPWALAALWLFDPRSRTWFRQRPAAVSDLIQAARFLRRAARPEEGVFTTWGDGNAIAQKAERPVLVTSFGSYLSPDTFWGSERAWLGTEAALDDFLTARRVRWIVAGAGHFGGGAVDEALPPTLARGASGQGGFNLRFFQRVPLASLVVGGSGAPRAGVAQLHRWMPRFSAGLALRTRETVVPTLWVYELVEGATVRGVGPEGSLVTLTTRLTLHGVSTRHVAWTRVHGGAFSLRTALPTRWRSANLATPDPAVLVVGDSAPRPFEVPEAAVRLGQTL
jgi:hypothetical protein